jgi:PAS domain S-box-containing protein
LLKKRRAIGLHVINADKENVVVMPAQAPLLDKLQTELHDAQEQLAVLLAAQKGYEEIFLSTNANKADILLILGKNLRVDYVSPSSWPITGYIQEEVVGRSCLDFIHPDDLPCALDAFFEIIDAGQCDGSFEFRIRHKSGFYVPVEAMGHYMDTILDAGGIIIHYRNMTNQKKSEHEILEQKKFYETILNTIYDGVFVTDRNDIITFINSAFSFTTGLSAAGVIGKNIFIHILTDSSQHFQHYYTQARSRLAPVKFDGIPATTFSGGTIFLSGWCIPKHAESIFDGMICTFTDISEQQNIKEKLSESETRFRSIAETATDGIITVKKSGEVIYWNSAATHIFGYSVQDILGKYIYKIMPDTIMHDHRAIFAEPERNQVRESIGRTIEGRARKKNGNVFPIELSLGSWTIGEDVYFTAIIRDITHRKHIEQSLQHSEQELKNLSSRLLNAHEQERKRIAYELHDGLGQILSAAKIGVQKLLDSGAQRRAAGTNGSTNNLPDIIQSAIEEVRRISRDLRPSILDDLGIITAINAFCFDFEKINETIAVVRKISARDEEIPEKIKIVIYRVTQEACANIVRHSHADLVVVTLSSVSGKVRLSIHDNGTGFDLQKLHEGRASYRGLGLSSMKERIELSGGDFLLSSSPDEGTTVQALWQSALTEAE